MKDGISLLGRAPKLALETRHLRLHGFEFTSRAPKNSEQLQAVSISDL
jgi:hypothetical protein